MALNPQIILSGAKSDVPGSFQRGLKFADERRQFAENRATAPLRQQAAQQTLALNGLKLDDAQRQKEHLDARRAVALFNFADTPEKWAQVVKKLGLEDQNLKFEDRDRLTEMSTAIVDAMTTPQKQSAFAEKMKALTDSGLSPKDALERLIPRRQGRAAKGPSSFAEKKAFLQGLDLSDERVVELLFSKGGNTIIQLGDKGFDFSGDESGGPDSASVGGDDVDPGLALGLGGAVRTAIFKTADFLNVGKFFPETAKAADNLTFLKTRFLFATRNMINQRMSNQMLDLVDKLTVAPGAIIGREGAEIRLQNGLDLVEDNVAGLQRVVDNREGKFSKKAVSDAAQDGILLTNLVQEYKEVIRALEGAETPAEPQEAPPPLPQSAVDDGVTPNQWQLMTPEQRALWQN